MRQCSYIRPWILRTTQYAVFRAILVDLFVPDWKLDASRSV